MNEWRKTKLGDISEMVLGKMLSKEVNRGEFEPYLANIDVRWGSFDFSNLGQMRFEAKEQERYGLKFGDLVICEGGEPGRCAIWKDEVPNMKIQKALHRVRLKENYDSNFTYYRMLIARRTGELEKHFIGSTIKHLTGIGLRQVEFEFPPLDEQKKIAAVLAGLDAKIELNRRMNAELERLAKTIYDYWFVQFDFPDANGRPYKSSGGKMTHNPTLKRQIPEGWEVKALADLVRCNYRSITKKEKFDYINYLDTSNLTENVVESLERIDLSSQAPPQRAQRIVAKNDILYSTVRPNQHHFGIITNPAENMIASSGFAQLTSKVASITNELLYMFLTAPSAIARMQQIADSAVSSYPSISPEDLLNLALACPTDQTVFLRFGSLMEPFYEKISVGHAESRQLAALRDWLLPMLMNGQVTVK